jgi:hypothetical protein
LLGDYRSDLLNSLIDQGEALDVAPVPGSGQRPKPWPRPTASRVEALTIVSKKGDVVLLAGKR